MAAYHALLGFAGWTLLLVIGVFAYRGLRFLQGTPINSWPRGAKPASGPWQLRGASSCRNIRWRCTPTAPRTSAPIATTRPPE